MISGHIVSDDATAMVFMGIDCIMQLFSVQSSRTRDFCRLFVKFGLLSHLPVAFRNLLAMYHSMTSASGGNVNSYENSHATSSRDNSVASNDDIAENDEPIELKYALHISTIFFNFSRSDALVAEQMAREGVLTAINEALKSPDISNPESAYKHLYSSAGTTGLSPMYIQIIELLLKCIKNLSMEPSVLQIMEEADTIRILIKLLNGPIRERCKNHVLPCMFNLCRINRKRQEIAAKHGFIPHLQKLIVENSHLRQFALPIICELAHNSKFCRAELWNNDGVAFYVNLLHEKYWQTFALNALATW